MDLEDGIEEGIDIDDVEITEELGGSNSIFVHSFSVHLAKI